MRHWIELSSTQVTALRLFGDKPLPEPILAYYCQLDLQEQIGGTEQWIKVKTFSLMNALESVVCKMSAILHVNAFNFEVSPQPDDCLLTLYLVLRTLDWRSGAPFTNMVLF